MGSCSFCHGHLLEHPLRMGEDHRLYDVAADLRRNTYIRQREQCQCPLMLGDSEPKEECDQSHNWVMVGKANRNRGGVKWVSNPCVRKNNNVCLPL